MRLHPLHRPFVRPIFLLSVAVTSLSLAGCASPQATTGGEELRWAKPVAEDFLEAVRQGNRTAAANLISKDFEARLRANDPNFAPNVPLTTRSGSAALLGGVLVADLIKTYHSEMECYRNIKTWEIRSESLSSNRSEAVFAGVLNMADDKEFKFRLRIALDKETGKWRVDSAMIVP